MPESLTGIFMSKWLEKLSTGSVYSEASEVVEGVRFVGEQELCEFQSLYFLVWCAIFVGKTNIKGLGQRNHESTRH